MTDTKGQQKEQIRETISRREIGFIRLLFTDIFGMSKNVAITADELDRALDGGLMFDGSSVDGFGRVDESDMYLVPDLDTFTTVPWRPGASEASTANIFCDVYGTDHRPFPGCPRNILRRALAEAREMGYTFDVGPEGEFFLFHLDGEGNVTMDIHDHAGYFDHSPVDRGEDARKDIVLTMKKYGFSIEASHHEGAPGQHEIDFRYDEALRTADMWMCFKQIVKNIAHSHNLYASFLPKPFPGQNGNAMHCNQSLARDGTNAFYDPGAPDGLSQDLRWYVGGLMKHAKGMAAVCNPIVNSYKRLVPGFEAPTSIAWSCSNRSAFIRIPDSRGEGTRVELRTPDPTANPYLVFAVMLRAGLEGIRKKTEPPREWGSSLYGMTEQERKSSSLEDYPRSLREALRYMKGDALVRETLGDHAFRVFWNAKNREWEEYDRQVHDWELRTYLRKY